MQLSLRRPRRKVNQLVKWKASICVRVVARNRNGISGWRCRPGCGSAKLRLWDMRSPLFTLSCLTALRV